MTVDFISRTTGLWGLNSCSDDLKMTVDFIIKAIGLQKGKKEWWVGADKQA